MKSIFEIRFGKSSSVNYKKALSLATSFDNFTEISNNSKFNIIITDNEEILSNYSNFKELYYLIKGWKSTRVTENKKEVLLYWFFQYLDVILRCSIGYEHSTSKQSYCNINETQKGWGCKHIVDIKKHLENSSYYYGKGNFWYKYGSFKEENIWLIDKERIWEKLEEEINTKKLYACPNFSYDSIKLSVNELPDQIDLDNSSDWEVEYQEDFIGTSIQKIAVSIRHNISETNDKLQSGVGISLYNLISGHEEGNSEHQSKLRYIPKVRFDDIGGIDGIIDKIREIIELPLKHPNIYQYLGIKPHKGILFYGEPGNGKTLIAKAIANEVKAHFIHISGPELVSKYYGQSEENLRNIFKEARDLQPTIIFFDEIDSVAQKRSDEETARQDAKFVNQLLTLMDGMEDYDNVTVLASTNRPELLDQALLRPGRFDFKLEIPRPDEIGCYKILGIACRKVPLDPSLDISSITPHLIGFSGADIVFIVKEAAINALKRSINIKDLIKGELHEDINYSNILVKKNDFLDTIFKMKNP